MTSDDRAAELKKCFEHNGASAEQCPRRPCDGCPVWQYCQELEELQEYSGLAQYSALLDDYTKTFAVPPDGISWNDYELLTIYRSSVNEYERERMNRPRE